MFGALILAAALYCPSLPAVAQHRLLAAIFDSDPNPGTAPIVASLCDRVPTARITADGVKDDIYAEV